MANNLGQLFEDSPYAMDILAGVLDQQPNQAEPAFREWLLHGLYVREVTMPAGALVIGANHPKEFIETMPKGKLKIVSAGYSDSIISAPYTGVGSPGVRKCLLTLEECIWINYFPIPDTIKTTKEANEYTSDYTNHYLADSKASYEEFLEAFSTTEDAIQDMMAQAGVIEITSDAFELRNSLIQGVGVFLTHPVPKNTTIGIAGGPQGKTTLGRYINHSHTPNTEVYVEEGFGYVRSLRTILGDEELTLDYKQVLSTQRSEI